MQWCSRVAVSSGVILLLKPSTGEGNIFETQGKPVLHCWDCLDLHQVYRTQVEGTRPGRGLGFNRRLYHPLLDDDPFSSLPCGYSILPIPFPILPAQPLYRHSCASGHPVAIGVPNWPLAPCSTGKAACSGVSLFAAAGMHQMLLEHWGGGALASNRTGKIVWRMYVS